MNKTINALQTTPPGRMVAVSFALYFSVDGDDCRVGKKS